MRTLVVGWFSFEQMGATAGDLIARDVVVDWLRSSGRDPDVAVAPPFEGGVALASVDPQDYGELVFVCGPFGNGPPVTGLLEDFSHCRLYGVDLSMLQDLDEWDPFDLLVERDSTRRSLPDVVFGGAEARKPVAGVVLVHRQEEYGERALHDVADDAVRRLVERSGAVAIPIDTRLDENPYGLSSAAQVEAVIARMDVIVTTRLHGTVLALKNGVPALPIDPIAGGAKIVRQVDTIGWPVRLTADDLDDRALDEAWRFCLTAEARDTAHRCAAAAREGVERMRDEFVAGIDATD